MLAVAILVTFRTEESYRKKTSWLIKYSFQTVDIIFISLLQWRSKREGGKWENNQGHSNLEIAFRKKFKPKYA